MTSIKEISDRSGGFKGNKQHRWAELPQNTQYTVDHSGAGRKNNVYTSIDCYVSGTYINKTGGVMEVKQRYTIYVSYNRDTMQQAMTEVRSRVVNDFSGNFPEFRISDVFIPDQKFIQPMGDHGLVEDVQFYQGSEMFKNMSRIDVAQYKIQMEGDIYKANVKNIKKRYGVI